MKTIMGIDASLSSTGICILKEGKIVHKESIQWKQKGETETASGKTKTLTDRQKIIRLCDIRDEVLNLVAVHQVDSAGIEGYAFAMRSASVTGLAELGGVLRASLFEECNIIPCALPVGQCRKFVVGSGKVTKVQTQEWLADQGLDFATDDEGDAYVVALTMHYIVNSGARNPLDVTRLELIDGITKGVLRRIPREQL